MRSERSHEHAKVVQKSGAQRVQKSGHHWTSLGFYRVRKRHPTVENVEVVRWAYVAQSKEVEERGWARVKQRPANGRPFVPNSSCWVY